MTRLAAIGLIVCALLITGPARAQDAASEAAIRAIVADQASAWNAGDGGRYAKDVAGDVSFTNLFGMVMYGAPAFSSRHSDILSTFTRAPSRHTSSDASALSHRTWRSSTSTTRCTA